MQDNVDDSITDFVVVAGCDLVRVAEAVLVTLAAQGRAQARHASGPSPRWFGLQEPYSSRPGSMKCP